MESTVLDTTEQSLETSGSGVEQVVVEEQRLNTFDAQIGGLENVEPESVSNASDDDITVEPSGDLKDEEKPPFSDILDKSDAHTGNTDESLTRMDGGSINDEMKQLDRAPLELDSKVMHSDHASHYSAGSRSLGNGFEMGDMVWGKVKSHPWWPGYIFDEAFTSSSVWRTKKDGQVLVAFFGDSSYGWFDLAELIPYDPHFVEKSQQSTSRNFMKAVEESIDEACRRRALGLTCFCRNPNNFRPTKVPGHIAVDVFDYEPGGIYSTDQIQKSRDNFHPERTLSFIEQVAATPRKAPMTLDFMREKAAAIAYRLAVYEEFDETYSQAFGHRAVRPIAAPPPTVDQSVQARFSGRLVTADPLSSRKSSAKAAKPREQLKKDKYLLKRRDEPGHMGISQTGLGNSSSSSSPCEDRQPNPASGDYILQKRDQPILGRDQQEVATPARDDEPASSHGLSKAGPSAEEERVVGQDTGTEKESHTPTGKKRKSGLLKGASRQLSAEKSRLGEKKKKKRKADFLASSDNFQKHSSSGEVSGGGEKPVKPFEAVVPSGATTDPVPTEKNSGRLQQVLSDLKALAVDPFHGREKNRPVIARNHFLRFRSLVFLKSSAASGDTEDSEVRSARISSGENKRSKPSSRPSKGEKKRVLSESQEGIATKRIKKVTAMKSASGFTEKRKAPEMQQPDGKGKGPVVANPRSSAKVEQPIKKQPQKARVEEPTFLVMKYPSGTSVPSSAELKARFARFGPMDTSQMRVFYASNTCRVLFLYKEDAESAYRFALGNKSAFSNVRFTLRPQAVAPDPQADKPSRVGDEMAIDHNVQNTHQTSSSAVQLKSCLKKPPGEEGESQSSGAVRASRVRFNVGPGGGKTTDSRINDTYSSSSSPSSVAMDVIHNNQPESILKNPLQPPLVSPPLHNHPPFVEASHRNYPQHTYTASRLPPPPLPPPNHPPLSQPPPVDISQQMLNLLTRCNDVVSNVKSVLGYVPYRPL